MPAPNKKAQKALEGDALKAHQDQYTPDPNSKYSKHKDANPNPNHGNRRCRDIICCIGFLAHIVASVCFAQMSFQRGDVNKLYRGIDMFGNVCGTAKEKQSSNTSVTSPQLDNSKRELYYPFFAEYQFTGYFMMFGLCVDACPNFPGDTTIDGKTGAPMVGYPESFDLYTGAGSGQPWIVDEPVNNPFPDLDLTWFGGEKGDEKLYMRKGFAKMKMDGAASYSYTGIPYTIPDNSLTQVLQINGTQLGESAACQHSGTYSSAKRADDKPAASEQLIAQEMDFGCRLQAKEPSYSDAVDPCTKADAASARRACYGDFPLFQTVAYYRSYCMPSLKNLTQKEEFKTMYAAFKNATEGANARARRAISDVYAAYDVILLSSLICVGLGFFWLLLLKYAVTCMVCSVLFGSVATLGAMGYFLVTMGQTSALSDDPNIQAQADYYLYPGYVFFVLAIVLLVLIICKRKNILIAIEIIQQASNAVRYLWFLPFYPIITCALIILFSIYALGTAVLLLSAGYLNFDAATGMRQISFDDTLSRIMWFQIFSFLWVNAFVVDFGKLVVAMAVGMWYFADNPRDHNPTTGEYEYKPPGSRGRKLDLDDPEDKKIYEKNKASTGEDGKPMTEMDARQGSPGSAIPREPFATLLAVHKGVRYHLGSVAFGAFIIALVRLLKVYLATLQEQAERAGPDNKIVKKLYCCIQCAVWCLEKCVEFINKNAYIQIGLFGESFCHSAYVGFMLMMRNCMLAATMNGIADILSFIGQIFIAMLTTIICYLLLDVKVQSGDIASPYIALIIIVILAWFIAGAFLQTFDMACDTILQCVLEDSERFGGSDDEGNIIFHYWDDDLQEIMVGKGLPADKDGDGKVD